MECPVRAVFFDVDRPSLAAAALGVQSIIHVFRNPLQVLNTIAPSFRPPLNICSRWYQKIVGARRNNNYVPKVPRLEQRSSLKVHKASTGISRSYPWGLNGSTVLEFLSKLFLLLKFAPKYLGSLKGCLYLIGQQCRKGLPLYKGIMLIMRIVYLMANSREPSIHHQVYQYSDSVLIEWSNFYTAQQRRLQISTIVHPLPWQLRETVPGCKVNGTIENIVNELEKHL